MIRLVLIHRYRMFCESLVKGLEASRLQVMVVGTANDGRKGVELVRHHHPDIVLTDVLLPELCGIEVTRQILSHCPRTRVIAVSTTEERGTVRRMLEAGARGYLLKSAELEELVRAIEVVNAGNVYLDATAASLICQDYRDGNAEGDETTAQLRMLTPREREVLQLIAEGHTTKEAAAILSVSTKTIETHRHRLMAKLEVRSVAQLTKIAIKTGLTWV